MNEIGFDSEKVEIHFANQNDYCKIRAFLPKIIAVHKALPADSLSLVKILARKTA